MPSLARGVAQGGEDQGGVPFHVAGQRPVEVVEAGVTGRRRHGCVAEKTIEVGQGAGLAGPAQIPENQALQRQDRRVAGFPRQKRLAQLQRRRRVSLLQADIGEIGPRLVKIRIDAKGAGESLGRLLQPLQLAQGVSLVVVGLGVSGLEGERPAVAGHGVFEPPQLRQGVPLVAVGIGVIGLAGQRRVVERRRMVTRLIGDDA